VVAVALDLVAGLFVRMGPLSFVRHRSASLF